MSKKGAFLFLFAGLFYAALLAYRLLYQGWHDSLWVPLVLGTIFFISALVLERRSLLGFFAMRTTKHGMNMGVLILLVLAGLACVNVLAVRYEKKWDWTNDKLFSLSDQSVKAARALKAETEIVLLYRPGEPASENIDKNVKDLVDLFSNVSDKIKFTTFNVLRRPDVAKKYEFSFGAFAVYAVQGAQKVKIDQPTEEGVTRALLRFGRENKKIIYFTTGHGERDLEAKDADGLSQVRDELMVTYDVRPLRLFDVGNKVPDDAGAVAIVRPLQQFLDAEIQALREYARLGGHLFVAIDPGIKHNLAQLTKTLGIEFRNDYVIDIRSQVIQSGPQTVLGTAFSRTSEVTKALSDNAFAIFDIVSSLEPAKDAAETLKLEPLVQTDEKTMTVPELVEKIELNSNGPHNLAVASSGKLPGEGTKEFEALIFGDSDFLANRIVHNNLNRDLVMNSFAWLMNDKDLISIRPKEAKGTKLNLTQGSFDLFAFAFLLPLPLLLFCTGGFWWWRRRTA
ncbi:MAG: Gldg family protein [Bdellovibrionota bacterium]|mgnify:FL=1